MCTLKHDNIVIYLYFMKWEIFSECCSIKFVNVVQISYLVLNTIVSVVSNLFIISMKETYEFTFLSTISVQMGYNFFEAICAFFKERELLHFQGRYGMLRTAVHIQDPVISVRVLRLFHNN